MLRIWNSLSLLISLCSFFLFMGNSATAQENVVEIPVGNPSNSEGLSQDANQEHSVRDLIVFTDTVSEIVRVGTCEEIEKNLVSIDPNIVQKASYVVHHIREFDVTSTDILRVEEASKAIVIASKTCPAVIQLYRVIASRD